MSADQAPIFSLIVPGEQPAGRVGSLWTPVASSAVPSFVLDDGVTNEPIWRVALPEDLQQAQSELTAGARQLAGDERNLVLAEQRFNQGIWQLQQRHGGSYSGPEAALMANLEQSALLEVASFSIISDVKEVVTGDVADWFKSTWKGLKSLFAAYTWVETAMDGRLLANTGLGRSGDILTAWREDVTFEVSGLHHEAIRMAVKTRQTMLRTLTIILRGAVMITGLLIAPGSAVLAVPAIAKYLNDLRSELMTDGAH